MHNKPRPETSEFTESITYKNKEFTIPKSTNKIFYDSSNASSRAIPAPTIEFASFCLSNCLKLLEGYQSEHFEEFDDDGWKHIQYNICNPSLNLTVEIRQKLLACAYVNSSYVAIELGDYVTALLFTKKLSKMENISASYM